MLLTSSMEVYLEAIWVLHQQQGYVRCTNVAKLLKVTKPSVSNAVKVLTEQRYLLKNKDSTVRISKRFRNVKGRRTLYDLFEPISSRKRKDLLSGK